MSGFVISSRDVASMRQRATLGAAGTSVLAPKLDEHAVSRAARRKAASDARAKRWPNTLAATRELKERAREDRLKRAEAERMVTDELEEARRLEERADTLERARDALIANTDKMKMLRAQQMKVKVALVRRKQLQMKDHRREAERQRERAYHEDVMAKVREGDEAELAAAEAKQARSREVQRTIHEQLEEVKGAAKARAAAAKAEGKAIRRAAVAAERDEEAAEQARRAEQRRNNEAMLRANHALKSIKASRVDEERKEAEALMMYKDAKDAKEQRRKDFMAAKRAASERRAGEMRAIIEDRFKAAAADEGAKLEAQQSASRAKADAAAATKGEDKAALQAEIDLSRRQQMARRRAAKDAARRQDMANSAKWGGVVQRLADEEAAAVQSKRDAALAVSRANLRITRSLADGLQHHEADERGADVEALREGTDGDTGFTEAAAKLVEAERRAGRRTDFIERSIARAKKEPILPAGVDI